MPTLNTPDQSIFAKKEKCNYTTEAVENELDDIDLDAELDLKPFTKVKTNITNELDNTTSQTLGYSSMSVFLPS